ncbi:hypothetical protein Tco_0968950 [Tanacetum coccineum]
MQICLIATSGAPFYLTRKTSNANEYTIPTYRAVFLIISDALDQVVIPAHLEIQTEDKASEEKLTLKTLNTTTTAPLTFFTPAADKVTNHSCSELVEKYKPADPKKIPAEILAVQGKSRIFQFHLNNMGSFTDLTLNAVYDIKKPTNSTTDIAQAVDKGTTSSTSAIITESIEKQEETDKGKEKSSPQASKHRTHYLHSLL